MSSHFGKAGRLDRPDLEIPIKVLIGYWLLNSQERYLMKLLKLPLLLAIAVGLGGAAVQAQTMTDKQAAPMTRQQIKMERDEFLKLHRYDAANEEWILRPNIDPPAGMKTRAQVRAERDEFLKAHKFDSATESWLPLKGEPKSTLTRAEVRAETAQFMKTHEWDELNERWVDKAPRKAKAK
jgi:hypothetical protein